MKNIVPIILPLILFLGCNKSKDKASPTNPEQIGPKVVDKITVVNEDVLEQPKSIQDFIPKGFRVFEKISGDLNNDGIDDCVIMIKDTDKANFVIDEHRGELDRNRRGIIILFKVGNGYQLATKNYTCFSSENEEGGVYYAPELSLEILKNKLYVYYAHGRYGYWRYTFRHDNSDFSLIGFDSADHNGGQVVAETSINFLTGKKLHKDNINRDDPDADEVFENTWTKVDNKNLLKLSQIKNFDELEFRF